jgi:hypothetical protein
MVEVSVVEVLAVSEDPAVREIPLVIEEDLAMTPVKPPMWPSPTEPTIEPDSKAVTKDDLRSSIKDPGNRIPARPGNQGISVCQPGIVLRDVNNLRICGLDDDRVSLLGYLFLGCTVQVSGFPRPLAHAL